MNMNLNHENPVALKPRKSGKELIEVGWESPANIALIKYWGKTGNQIPLNPSLSITLSASVTRTVLRATEKKSPKKDIELKYIFEGWEHPGFRLKVLTYLEKLQDTFPFIGNHALEFDSVNTFPHSAGIASSASSMSAIALCLLSLEEQITGKQLNIHAFLKKASNIARIGSGSACRSIYGNYVFWGKAACLPRSGDLSAVPLPVRIHPVFVTLHDSILVVSQGEKPVSSRAGHQLMDEHPFRKGRIQQVNLNLKKIFDALSNGDWDKFSSVVENESFTIHGLMMSSDPGYLLIKPNTIRLIDKINAFRKNNNVKLTYTLDAGPNLHVLYPDSDSVPVRDFIHNDLAPLCENNYVIHDQIGSGPRKIL
jgi:diphosphomevalonate decarboxylase